RCTRSSYVAPASFHAWVEFGNRVVSGLVGIVVLLVAVTSLLLYPRRKDLILLAWGLVAGFIAQIILGGLTVLFGLSPLWVMAHFLASMVILWDALVLQNRAHPSWSPAAQPLVRKEIIWLGRLLATTAGVVLVLGTVTTGTGPHAGDAHAPRLHFPLER